VKLTWQEPELGQQRQQEQRLGQQRQQEQRLGQQRQQEQQEQELQQQEQQEQELQQQEQQELLLFCRKRSRSGPAGRRAGWNVSFYCFLIKTWVFRFD